MVSDQVKEFSGGIGKYHHSSNRQEDYLGDGEAHDIFTVTCSDSDKFLSTGGNEQENEMSSPLTCPLKLRFEEFGSVSKVSSDTSYQRIGRQSRSIMSPIEVIYSVFFHIMTALHFLFAYWFSVIGYGGGDSIL